MQKPADDDGRLLVVQFSGLWIIEGMPEVDMCISNIFAELLRKAVISDD